MQLPRLQSTLRITIVLAFMAVIIFGIGQVFYVLNSGASRSELFKDSRVQSSWYKPELEWVTQSETAWNISAAQKNKIEADYINAWNIKNNALAFNQTEFLADAFTQEYRGGLETLIAQQIESNSHQENITLTHKIDLQFLSEDGKIVQFIDQEVQSYTGVYTNNNLIQEARNQATYNVIMYLQDGFWRVRHMEQLAINPTPTPDNLTIDNLALSGLNYYPKDSPWDTFGPNFSESVLGKDFKIIKNLGANTVRVFINYFDFGQEQVRPEKLQKLKQLLDIAQAQELKVIVTLFDFYGDYSLAQWHANISHINQIASAIKTHPALHSWDIKNEPDLDFDAREAQRVKAWLVQMIFALKATGIKQPVTIGWSSPEAALQLTNTVDYVSFHFYKKPETLMAAIQQLNNHTTKPTVLQEFGFSTNRNFFAPFGGSKKGQSNYYSTMLATLKETNTSVISWTLYDFKTVPSQVSGWQPWRKNKQANFGILDHEGQPKLALKVLQDYFK